VTSRGRPVAVIVPVDDDRVLEWVMANIPASLGQWTPGEEPSSEGLAAAIGQLKAEAAKIAPAPASLVLFGSYVRGEAKAGSDLDVLVVQPSRVFWNDDAYMESLARWENAARRITGYPVELLTGDLEELPELLDRNGSVWQTVAAEGVVLAGRSLNELAAEPSPTG